MPLLLAGIAAGSFITGQTYLARDNSAEAQVEDEIPAVAAAAERAIRDDAAKPRFEGTLNGIIFYDPAKEEAVEVEICTDDNAAEIEGPEATEAIQRSLLNFDASLPTGSKLIAEGAAVCGGETVNVARSWSTEAGPPISIAHFARPPMFVAEAPEDRLEATTIAGKSAVIVKPKLPNHVTKVLLTGEDGSWLVSGYLEPGEMVSIAESLK